MIDNSKTWQELVAHQQTIPSLTELFTADKQRAKHYTITITTPKLLVDFSKNQIDQPTLTLLLQLAEEAKLAHFIEAMFTGTKINNTENRAVLHTALRNRDNTEVIVDGKNVMPEINATLHKIQNFCGKFHQQQWLGFSNKPITDIVNIGIGGSDLGPQLVVKALSYYKLPTLTCHFISNIDPTDLQETLSKLNPETTLFIVSSKSFTTEETLANALAARDWLLQQAKNNKATAKHFIAVSANPQKAEAFGINKENVFAFWDFVGGRYSLWSAIGLPIALSIGFDNFIKLLSGAQAMDLHFRHTPFTKNVPVLLGLIGIWYRNFFHTSTHSIIPYLQSLQLLPNYLQQLDMESNGKQVTREGKKVRYKTGPIIWGGHGTNGQYAFHQLLHQGTDLIPIDFIVAKKSLTPVGTQQDSLYANCLAQAEALLVGRKTTEIYRG